MRLLGVKFDHYKSIEDSELPVEGLSILFGINASGKSNALEGLEALLAQFRGKNVNDVIRVDPGRTPEENYPTGGFVVDFPDCENENHVDNEVTRYLLCGAAFDDDRGWDRLDITSSEYASAGLESIALQCDRPSSKPALFESRAFWADAFSALPSPLPENSRRLLFQEVLRTTKFLFTNDAVYPVVPLSHLSGESKATMAALGDDEHQTHPVSNWIVDCLGGNGIIWPTMPAICPMTEELRRTMGAALPTVVRVRTNIGGLNEEIRRHIDSLLETNDPDTSTRVCYGKDSESSADSGGNRYRSVPTVSDPWFEESESLDSSISSGVVAQAELLAGVANEVAPSFVRNHGTIGIEVLPASLFDRFPERLRVVIKVHGKSSSPSRGQTNRVPPQIRDITTTGTGLARWAAASLREAMWRLRRREEKLLGGGVPKSWEDLQDLESQEAKAASGLFKETVDKLLPELKDGVFEQVGWRLDRRASFYLSAAQQAIYLIDEPEIHLHPAALDSVGEWLLEVSRRHAGAVIATHSSALLSLPSDSVELVYAQPGPPTRLMALNDDLVAILREQAEVVGLREGDLLMLARAVLVVEGSDDERVLMHYFGKEIRSARLIILPLHGTLKAMALVQTEFFERFGKPLILFFDNTTREKIERSRAGQDVTLTPEERKIQDLFQKAEGSDLFRVADNPFPDIVCALPEPVVAEVLQRNYHVTFPGWEPLRRAFNEDPTKSFKKVFLGQLGIKGHAPAAHELVDEIIDHALKEPPGEEILGELQNVVKAAIALATDEQWDRGYASMG